ncbi:MAG: DUF3127 domain-containing protein [Bacteroidota bacterium]
MYTYTGILKVKTSEHQVSDRFKKREFVLTDNAPSYPQTILFQLTQDRCGLVELVNVNEEITVHFEVRGREWRNPAGEIKFFNSLEVFKIERANSNTNSQSTNVSSESATESTMHSEQPGTSDETLVPTPDENLPF